MPNLRLIDGMALIELLYAQYEKFEPRNRQAIGGAQNDAGALRMLERSVPIGGDLLQPRAI
jgi:hypothetical protein